MIAGAHRFLRMNKKLVGVGVAVALVAGLTGAYTTNAFGAFGHDLRVEVNGTGRAAEVALAWPGDFDPVAVAVDTTLPWSAAKTRRSGVFIVVASGVADGATCRLLSNGVEIAAGTAEDGKVACLAKVGDRY